MKTRHLIARKHLPDGLDIVILYTWGFWLTTRIAHVSGWFQGMFYTLMAIIAVGKIVYLWHAKFVHPSQIPFDHDDT